MPTRSFWSHCILPGFFFREREKSCLFFCGIRLIPSYIHFIFTLRLHIFVFIFSFVRAIASITVESINVSFLQLSWTLQEFFCCIWSRFDKSLWCKQSADCSPKWNMIPARIVAIEIKRYNNLKLESQFQEEKNSSSLIYFFYSFEELKILRSKLYNWTLWSRCSVETVCNFQPLHAHEHASR